MFNINGDVSITPECDGFITPICLIKMNGFIIWWFLFSPTAITETSLGTSHKVDKVVVDIGKKEFCAGLTFVAISRVRRMTDLLLNPPFAFQRLKNLSKSRRLHERQQAEQHLLLLQTTTIPPTDNCSSTQQGLCLHVYIFCIDHAIPSSPWMEDATPPLEWMEDTTPSPPLEWMEDATPSPPSE